MTASDSVAVIVIVACLAIIVFRQPYAARITRDWPGWLQRRQSPARTEFWIVIVAIGGIALALSTIISRAPMRGLEGPMPLDSLTSRDYIGLVVYVVFQVALALGSVRSRATYRTLQVLTFVSFLFLLSYLPERSWPAGEPFGLVVLFAGVGAAAAARWIATRGRNP